jgi:hypothetical protein
VGYGVESHDARVRFLDDIVDVIERRYGPPQPGAHVCFVRQDFAAHPGYKFLSGLCHPDRTPKRL